MKFKNLYEKALTSPADSKKTTYWAKNGTFLFCLVAWNIGLSAYIFVHKDLHRGFWSRTKEASPSQTVASGPKAVKDLRREINQALESMGKEQRPLGAMSDLWSQKQNINVPKEPAAANILWTLKSQDAVIALDQDLALSDIKIGSSRDSRPYVSFRTRNMGQIRQEGFIWLQAVYRLPDSGDLVRLTSSLKAEVNQKAVAQFPQRALYFSILYQRVRQLPLLGTIDPRATLESLTFGVNRNHQEQQIFTTIVTFDTINTHNTHASENGLERKLSVSGGERR